MIKLINYGVERELFEATGSNFPRTQLAQPPRNTERVIGIENARAVARQLLIVGQ